VTATDIINLADHTCYVKTQVGRDRLPVMHVETLSPQTGDRAIAEQVIGQMSRYARPVKVVEAERKAFLERWFGREINNTLREVQGSAEGSEKTAKTDKSDKDKKGNKAANTVEPKSSNTPEARPTDQVQGKSGTTTGSVSQPPDATADDKSAKNPPEEPPSEPPAPETRMNP
jgi:hypothetical protein